LKPIIVLDASVAVKWFVHDVSSDEASLVAHKYKFIAPNLIMTEVANALWTYARRGDVSSQDLVSALKILDKRISLLNQLSIVQMASQLACDLNHPVYDCMYLAVSRMQHLPLLTADKRLVKIATSEMGLEVVDLNQIPLDK